MHIMLQMYVVCSLLLFVIPQFSPAYAAYDNVRLLPYLLPLAHIAILGSVYCTLAMTIERFLAVHYPFLPLK